MPVELSGKLLITISSRALFDLDASHRVFEKDGIEAYQQYQIENEDKLLAPGVAFPLVKKLLNIRDPNTNEALVEVVLLSRNSADTGLRIFNSIQQHELDITRAVFTSGESPYQYISAFGSHLFLSANPPDVEKALEAGCAAATIMPHAHAAVATGQLRIAFDGDAVIFSDEAERIYQEHGLEHFARAETASARKALSGGPLKGFLSALQLIQQRFPIDTCPVRTALVTARSAPAHERVIRTLREWNIRIDEAIFLGGLDKGTFLRAFGADFFFDDQMGHCNDATQHVATAHVPHGVINEH